MGQMGVNAGYQTEGFSIMQNSYCGESMGHYLNKILNSWHCVQNHWKKRHLEHPKYSFPKFSPGVLTTFRFARFPHTQRGAVTVFECFFNSDGMLAVTRPRGRMLRPISASTFCFAIWKSSRGGGSPLGRQRSESDLQI